MKLPQNLFASLPTRVVLSVIFLVILTVTVVGLPAILQTNAELERQTTARAESGAQVMALLIEAERAELSQATLLASSRPTLQSLLSETAIETGTVLEYLETLRHGIGVDGLLLCGQGRAFATGAEESMYGAGADQPGGACAVIEEKFLLSGSPVRAGAAWLVVQREMENLPESAGNWRILAGHRLDASMAEQMALQAGLDVILLVNKQPVAASLAELLRELPAGVSVDMNLEVSSPPGQPENFRLSVQETQLAGLEIAAALNLSEFEAASRQLTWRIGLGMAAAALAGSLLGVWAAGSVTRPLENLRRSAEGLRHGDLFTPVRTRSPLREIQQVTFALEEARAALQHSLSQLQHEKEWTAHLLDSIVEGIITLDRSGRVVFFSPGALRIFGLTEEQVLGRSLPDVIDAPGLAELLARIADSPQSPAQLSQFAYRRPGPSGIERTLSISTAHLQAPEAGGMAIVVRDVTEDERLHRLTGDFLANITHEFRTPLSALAAATELLVEQAVEERVGEDMQRMLDNLRLSILSLQTLTDNLLEGASIESGRFRVSPRPAGLQDTLETAAATMRPLVEKYGQVLQVVIAEGTPKWVSVDPVRTRQVLANLLSNAARFGREGGIVQLTARPADDVRFVKIAVSDQGAGLPESAGNGDMLFQRFARLSPAEGRAEAGAGIGLSVVRAIVEAQGGRAGAANNPAGGAIFWITVQAEASLEGEP
jgi:two-component system phosphate regulon sensor histidine kinase PhoR